MKPGEGQERGSGSPPELGEVVSGSQRSQHPRGLKIRAVSPGLCLLLTNPEGHPPRSAEAGTEESQATGPLMAAALSLHRAPGAGLRALSSTAGGPPAVQDPAGPLSLQPKASSSSNFP